MSSNEIPKADLTACDREQIHIPGMIQPFGALVVVELSSFYVVQCSDNLADILKSAFHDATGQPLANLIGGHAFNALRTALKRGELHSVSPALVRLPSSDRRFNMFYHCSDQLLIAEFEPVLADAAVHESSYRGELPFHAIHECHTEEELARLLVKEVKRLTEFDRVIAYRFDEDWHGIVVAEEKNSVYPESFLGHHFPASDIPVPARKLFALNRFRIIPDVDYQPVPIVPQINPITGKQLDLTYSLLRNVSPVHLEYLRNMHVKASVTLSLMNGQRLWGMITCHHAAPKKVPSTIRLQCKALAELASYAIAAIEQRNITAATVERRDHLAKIRDWLAKNDHLMEGIESAAELVLHALDSDGLLMRLGGQTIELGASIPQEAVTAMQQALVKDDERDMVHTRHLTELDPRLSAIAPQASGALYVRLGSKNNYFIALRKEITESRTWAGNPNKPAMADPLARLHPRKSFDMWKETVRGHARRWRVLDVETALELRRLVLERREQIVRQEFETALRIERDRIQGILETMTEGFTLVDAQFRVLQINPEGLRLLRQLEAATLGRPLWDLWPDIAGSNLEQFFRRAMPMRTSVSIEHRVDHASAPSRWLDFRAYPSGDGLAIFFRDITERKAAEEALRQLNDTLEERVAARTAELASAHEQLHQSQKMEALGQLTGGIAHDFNNLLASMVSSLDMLRIRMQQGRAADLPRYLDIADASAQKAAALTHRLLSFSRQQTLEPKPIDVNQLTISMKELIRRTVGPSIEINMVLSDDPWSTLCDPNQLENALLNLAINGRDAMPQGGTLTIRTENMSVKATGELPAGDYVAVTVADTGTGMPPEVVARAFDPFFTTKPSGQGTGLGLSMIYGFVKQSGGHTRIDSTPGKGTRVALYLPRHLGEVIEQENKPKLFRLPKAAIRSTVLLVEDEPHIRTLLIEMLQEMGYDVISASDGQEAVQKLQSDAPISLLLADIGLPGGMDGLAIAKAGRMQRPNLKVLFITGYGEQTTLAKKAVDSTTQVIAKPFAMDILADKIRGMISVTP